MVNAKNSQPVYFFIVIIDVFDYQGAKWGYYLTTKYYYNIYIYIVMQHHLLNSMHNHQEKLSGILTKLLQKAKVKNIINVLKLMSIFIMIQEEVTILHVQ